MKHDADRGQRRTASRLRTVETPVHTAYGKFLAQAERAKIKGDEYTAIKYYDLAVTHAGKKKALKEKALACELAGKFFHETGRSHVAGEYFIMARKAYQKCGAPDRAAYLSDHYPQYATLSDSHTLPGEGKPVKGRQDMDLAVLINAAQTISGEAVISRLMDKLMSVVLENAGAQKGYLILNNGGQWMAEARVGMLPHKDFVPVPLAEVNDLSSGMVRYVSRTGEDLVLASAFKDKRMVADPYIRSENLKSALCLPIRHQGAVTGVLYLENNRLEGVFTPERVGVFKTVAKILANAWARNLAQKEVLAYQDQLRSLSSKLLLVEKRERRQLAQALHDQVGKALSRSIMKFEKLKHDHKLAQWDEFAGIRQVLHQTIEDIRTLTFELSPKVLYDLGLSAALDWLADQTVKIHQVDVRFFDRGLCRPIEENLRVLMFQSVRELMFNMVKHAGAKNASLTAGMEGDDLWVVLEDDGTGFDPDQINPQGGNEGGFGLFSIQERLRSQGGHMHITTSPGKGTHIKLVLPATAPQAF